MTFKVRQPKLNLPAVLVEEVLGLAYPVCTYNTVIRHQQKQPKTYGTTNKIKVKNILANSEIA
jgi:hypothetical protein